MPRGSNGIHTLPAGYRAIDGEIILPTQHNPPLEDLSQAITDSLPRNGSASMVAPLNCGGYGVINAAQATAGSSLTTLDQVAALIAAAAVPPTPSGSVVAFAGGSVPTGWLLCNGATVSRTTYAALFIAIGTTYGVGDGSTTFRLPDLRGEFIRGHDAGRGIDAGRDLGTAQSADLAPHTHLASSIVTDPGHAHSGAASSPSGAFGAFGSAPAAIGTTGSATTGITVATTVSANAGSETRPRNVALNYIIKA